MLLLYIGLDHLRSETSGQFAVLTALEQDANYDVGIAARREADEPSVLSKFVAVLVFRAKGERNDLGRASFPCDINTRHVRRWRGAFGQQDARHRVRDVIPPVGIDREALDVGEVSRFYKTGRQIAGIGHMRHNHTAAHGYRADRAQELHWRDRDRALSDADRDCFAGEPLLLEIADLPLFRRHDAGDFVGKIDAGLLPQAEVGGVFRDTIDA